MNSEQSEADFQATLAFRDALAAVEAIYAGETANTGKYTYKYVKLPDVLEEVKRVCQLFDLSVTQTPTAVDGMLAVATWLIHKSGGTVWFDPIMLPMPREAQALGSAITYLRRYSLLTIFGIPTEDDDGAAASKATRAPDEHGGYRTGAEERIVNELSTLPDVQARAIRQAFRAHFGVGLSDLAPSRHGDALTYVLEQLKHPAVEAQETPHDEPVGTG